MSTMYENVQELAMRLSATAKEQLWLLTLDEVTQEVLLDPLYTDQRQMIWSSTRPERKILCNGCK